MTAKKKKLTKRSVGQPTLLTPEVQKRICEAIETCGTLIDAAASVGVTRASLFNWCQKGREQEEGIYRDFYEAVERAKSQRRMNFSRKLMKHGEKTWQALAWLAERTDPKHFGLRVKLEVQQELEAALEILRTGLPPDQYETVLSLISRGAGSPEIGDDSIQPSAAGSEAGGVLGSTPAQPAPAAVPEPG